MKNEELEILLSDLKRQEGCSLRSYYCPAGYITIGFGHKIESSPITISKEYALELLLDDVKHAKECANNLFPNFYTYPDQIQRAIVNMIFQMGEHGVEKFYKMCAAIKQKDWDTAYKEALDSKWAKKDSPIRAREVASLFLLT